MHKQKLKLFFIILLMISCIFSICTVSFAKSPTIEVAPETEESSQKEEGTPGNKNPSTSNDAFNFNKVQEVSGDETANDLAFNTLGTLIVVIRVVGMGVAIIMLSVLGMKYMAAAPNEKADFKKSATIYIVGAILVFAGSNIITIIMDFAQKNIAS